MLEATYTRLFLQLRRPALPPTRRYGIAAVYRLWKEENTFH